MTLLEMAPTKENIFRRTRSSGFVLASGELRGITVSDTEQGRAFVVQKPIAEFMRRFPWALSRVIG
jgi:hypothetical protein